MRVLEVRNVQHALPAGLDMMRQEAVRRDSRNGPVLQMTTPVTTVYNRPTERVIFWAEREANPFFHLMESLWMLAGRNDVEYVTRFVKTMADFSDDGQTFHGAYGHRWRVHFGFDQLQEVINNLKANPDDRRQVIQMWDARADLSRQGKDLPCNTIAFVAINPEGSLDLTVCNRSNDMIWGAYGANAVHFSVLLEYLAAGIGVPVGRYYQVSNNFHSYLKTYEPLAHLADQAPDPYRTVSHCPYERGEVEPYPLVTGPLEQWNEDLKMFMQEGAVVGLRDPFFRRCAGPVLLAHQTYSNNKTEAGIAEAIAVLEEQCLAKDWKVACIEWLTRRSEKLQRKKRQEDDGVEYPSGN